MQTGRQEALAGRQTSKSRQEVEIKPL